WAIGFFLIGITSFALCAGTLQRRLLVLIMVSLWSLRLMGFYIKRMMSGQEEGRFQAVQEWFQVKWFQAASQLKLLLLFFLQGLFIMVISWPIVLMSANIDATTSTLEWVGFALWLACFIGESIADSQLLKFRSRIENRFKVCNEGLWSLSRHPNYFFEFGIWIAFALMAFTAPFGFTAIVSPIAMWYLLMKAPGLDAYEAHALKIKGAVYEEYQRKTNRFIPWFPK
ncbi:MAG TPA: DUF1295 domain-containing protein, partial [Chlamydiales bacterium]|nr:DUF1295 domain-containing protein [Chlamydiales bacterium]